MAYNRENTRRIRREYEGKHLRAIEDAEARARDLALFLPDLAPIDEKLRMTGMSIYQAALRYKGQELEDKIAQLREENLLLQRQRAELLIANGYPEDYTDPKYECAICKDTGAVGIKMCQCMRKKIIEAGFVSSGIGHLMQTQTFETFSPALQRINAAEYETILLKCRNYAESFEKNPSRNLLLSGGTGLGKTHLSTAIAKVVIESGFDVVYESASTLLADYESERFDRSSRSEDEESRTARYTECDLLIIDDLGSEMTNSFTISVLYNLINIRINKAKAMLISTNLSADDLRARYSDRITSRIFGSCHLIFFKGDDMRMKKLMK